MEPIKEHSEMHSDDPDFMETCRIHSIDDFRQKVRECKRSGYLNLGIVRYNNDVIYLMGGNGHIVKIVCDFKIYNEDGSVFGFERMKDRLEIIGRVESFLGFYKI